MTASELMVLLREIADRKGLNMTFTCLADHFQELRLNSGMRLLDSSDWKHFFRELAIAARMSPDFSVPASAEPDKRLQLMRPASQRRWDEFCPVLTADTFISRMTSARFPLAEAGNAGVRGR